MKRHFQMKMSRGYTDFPACREQISTLTTAAIAIAGALRTPHSDLRTTEGKLLISFPNGARNPPPRLGNSTNVYNS